MTSSSKTAGALRRMVLALAALGLAAAAPAIAAPRGWTSGQVQGSGNIQTQTRQLDPFTGLSLSLPATLELRIGDAEGITIETDDNLLPLIDTVIEDGALQIRATGKNTNFQTRTLKIVVRAKQVERIALGGAGSIDSDALRGNRLRFDVGGSGSINIRSVEADSVGVTVGGSGKLKAGPGSARQLSVSIGGSGDVQLGQLEADHASVTVAGSGAATVAVRDTLRVTIAGSGGVNYYGDPQVSKTATGSGGVRRLGPAPR